MKSLTLIFKLFGETCNDRSLWWCNSKCHNIFQVTILGMTPHHLDGEVFSARHEQVASTASHAQVAKHLAVHVAKPRQMFRP